MTATTAFRGKLLDRRPAWGRPGVTWTSSVYATPRKGGRRIVVTDETGRELFDTGDQFDLANAASVVNQWFAGQADG